MMNILEQEDIIKGLPDQALMQEAQMPSGQVPQYLVVSEIQRRSDMRKRYKAEQEQMPQATVKEQVMQEGIMGAMPSQMAMAPQMAQRMPNMPPPQMPPTQMMSKGGEATLLDRYYNLDTDDPRGEGFELGADDDPSANRKGIFQGLSLLGVDQETIDNATRRTAEPPKGLVDIIEKVIYQGKKHGLIDEEFAPGIRLSEDDLEDLETSRAFTEAGLPSIKKANGGAVYKPLDSRTQGLLDKVIDSDQMGYADILSFIDQLPRTSSEDRAAMMEYVRGKTGVLERAGYQFGQAVDNFGDRLGSAFEGRLGSAYDQFMDEGGFSPGVGPRLGSAFNTLTGGEAAQKRPKTRLPTEEELRAGFPEGPMQYLTEDDFVQGMLPSPMGAGRSLITAGGRQLARQGLPSIYGYGPTVFDDLISQIRPIKGAPTGQLSAATQLGAPADAEDFDSRVDVVDSISDYFKRFFGDYQPNFEEIGKKRKEQAGIEEPLGIDPKPPMADPVLARPKGGIEEKGGGEEVQSTSADRMAELLDRMGRTNRGAALVALGTGIAEGKTMEGGKEAANILAKGQQAQTKLEIDATQFDQQMDLLEQRVKNAAKSGNASVIAALVSATSRELEALTDIVGLSDPVTTKRIQSLRNTLSQLGRTYMPTYVEADGIYSFGSLATGSPSRAKP